jgi:UDP-GlcNAc3NAcA epimerase
MMKKIKILTVVGARPQIIKAAAISRAIKNKFSEQLLETILHTGQHYDENMSKVFFDELGVPEPKFNLGVSNGDVVKMCSGINAIQSKEKFDLVLVYGDTNSTFAGARQAAAHCIPLAHVEAGLRSYNNSMPEEGNRVFTDSVSTLLFSPTKKGIENLVKEGFKENALPPYSEKNPKIYHCGDVMYDNSLYFSERAEKETGILQKYFLKKENFVLATVHRNYNTDSAERLNSIFSALNKISLEKNIQVIFPIHPRTSKNLERSLKPELFNLIKKNKNFILTEPVTYLEMISLEKNCKLIMTDSGGLQKEAFYFKKPCVILRSETEWTELVDCGSAILADADEKKIQDAYDHFERKKNLVFPDCYGDGKAAEFICTEIVKFFSEE